MHSTNYYNTFIEVAEDCKVLKGTIPPEKTSKKTSANLQFELLQKSPYHYSSDDVFFGVHAIRKDISEPELEKERDLFFSKGQPCFRSSPLTKTYGWGVHCNHEGKVALYSLGSLEYQKFLEDPSIKKVKAMRSKRK